MGTAERRLEILKYLCKARKATMPQLAEMFGVCVKTIQRDIAEIESTFRVPIQIRSGKYNGGICIIGDYSFDRMYMLDEEILLLSKLYELSKHQLSTDETRLFEMIIKKYSKNHRSF